MFLYPFYYIEYGMAQLGAVQLWANAIKDQAGAVAAYTGNPAAFNSLHGPSYARFIGQLGVIDLAALALVFPTQMTLGMMSAGAMGGGISSSVARALGSGNKPAAEIGRAHV